MNPNLLRNLSFFTRRLRLSPSPSILFSSRAHQPPLPDTHSKNSNNLHVEEISNEEIKRRVAKLQEGDAEAIPAVFEAILQRYLTDKPIEDDQELMKEILGPGTRAEDEDDDDDDDEDNLDSDLEGMSDFEDEDEEDFDRYSKRRGGADERNR